MTHSEHIPVLVVEDNLQLRKTLLMQLQAMKIKADAAANGTDALRRVQVNQYDLILMDIEMPGLTGLETTAAIRSFEEIEGRQTTAIVAVTGGGATMEQCLQVKMSGYFEKPILMKDLKRLISEHAPQLLS